MSEIVLDPGIAEEPRHEGNPSSARFQLGEEEALFIARIAGGIEIPTLKITRGSLAPDNFIAERLEIAPAAEESSDTDTDREAMMPVQGAGDWALWYKKRI